MKRFVFEQLMHVPSYKRFNTFFSDAPKRIYLLNRRLLHKNVDEVLYAPPEIRVVIAGIEEGRTF